MGNSLNKTHKPSSAGEAETGGVGGTKKCSNCECSPSQPPASATAVPASVTKEEGIVPASSPVTESFTKDASSSMIVLHSDAPSETGADVTSIKSQETQGERTQEGKAEEAKADEETTDFSREKPSAVPVTEFSIANQKLKLSLAADVKEHVEKLRAHAGTIKMVRLNGNTIGVEAAKELAEAVKGLVALEEFYLNDCFTGRMKEEVHVAVEEFCRALKQLKHLRTVDFSDNAFGPIGARAASTLLSEATGLQKLIINNCGLGPEGGKIIAQALKDCQTRNEQKGASSSLRIIQMGRNRLENGSAPYLAEAFAAHGLLEEIALPQCGIRQEGVIALSKGIEKNPGLRRLNLQDNTFTNEASIPLAKALSSVPKLTFVDVGDCLVGDAGCKAILEALVEGGAAETLEVLNLQYGEMNEEGALLLSGLLTSKFKNLRILMLNGNAFDPNGRAAVAIKDALQLENREDILDSWSDMDYEEDDDGELSDSSQSGRNSGPLPRTEELTRRECELSADLAKLEINSGN